MEREGLHGPGTQVSPGQRGPGHRHLGQLQSRLKVAFTPTNHLVIISFHLQPLIRGRVAGAAALAGDPRDFPFLGHNDQLLRGDPEAFPGQC